MNIKNLFPIFKNRPEITYLDSAATSQKPQQVIDAMSEYYSMNNANIKRGIYSLAENTTTAYEDVRVKVASFVNVQPEEIVFTSSATEGVNFIAQAWGSKNISAGDEILVTELEHHSNFLPWQRLVQEKGAILKIAPIKFDGKLDYEAFSNLVTPKTKLIALTAQSNVTGEIVDLKRVVKLAKQIGAKLFVDAAQAIAHKKMDVKTLNCDFLTFSAHKIFGPTGVGVLFIKKEIQDEVQPYQVGGGMVFEVGITDSKWLQPPYKFEAGTTPIAQVIGLGAAIDFINANINFDELHKHETSLSKALVEELQKIDAIKFVADPELLKGGHVVTFNIKDHHAHDVAAFLDKFGICVRAGNHCAQPLHKALGINSSIRVSFAVYNTMEDVYKLVNAIKKL